MRSSMRRQKSRCAAECGSRGRCAAAAAIASTSGSRACAAGVSAVAEKETLSRSEIDELYAALKKLEENCHD